MPSRINSRRVAGLVTSVLAVAALGAWPGVSASAASMVVPFVPMAGNATHLVYVQNAGTCSKPDLSLEVRDNDGTIETLDLVGSARATLDRSVLADQCVAGPIYDPVVKGLTTFFSLVGNTLTGEFTTPRGKHPTVFWWDLTGHRHGQRPTAIGASYQGAVPGGWLYTRSVRTERGLGTHLIREGIGGEFSSYGTYREADEVVTGVRGVVLVRHGFYQRYLAYGATTPVRLTLAHHQTRRRTQCSTLVTAAFAACTTEKSFGRGPVTQTLLPLDGKGRQTCAATCYPGTQYIISTASPSGITTALGNGTLVTLRPNGTTTTGSSHGIADRDTAHPAVYTAYGKLIVRHASGNITEQSTLNGVQKVLLHS